MINVVIFVKLHLGKCTCPVNTVQKHHRDVTGGRYELVQEKYSTNRN